MAKNDFSLMEKEERDVMQKAMEALKVVAGGRPCICIIAFEANHGTNVCSAANVAADSQVEMLNILVKGYAPAPANTTLN